MTTVLQIRLALTIIGLVLFIYGVRVEETRLRWIGIAFLAASLLLRWWNRPRSQG